MTFETVTATKRLEIEFGASGFKVKLFWLSDDPHDQSRIGDAAIWPSQAAR